MLVGVGCPADLNTFSPCRISAFDSQVLTTLSCLADCFLHEHGLAEDAQFTFVVMIIVDLKWCFAGCHDVVSVIKPCNMTTDPCPNW